MEKNIEKSTFMALSLIILFVVKSIWLTMTLSKTTITMIELTIIGICLVFTFQFSGNSKVKYVTLIKKGFVVGLMSGITVATFIFIYTNFIDTYYFEKLAEIELQNYAKLYEVDSYAENQFLKGIGVMKKYNTISISAFIIIPLYSVALSMFIAPFYLKKNKIYDVIQ